MYFFKLYNFEHQLYFLFQWKKNRSEWSGELCSINGGGAGGHSNSWSSHWLWEEGTDVLFYQVRKPGLYACRGDLMGQEMLLYCHLPAKGGWPFWIGFPLFHQRPPVHSGSWVTGSSCYPCSGLNWPGMRWVLLDLLIDVRFPAPWECCNDTAKPKSFDLEGHSPVRTFGILLVWATHLTLDVHRAAIVFLIPAAILG